MYASPRFVFVMVSLCVATTGGLLGAWYSAYAAKEKSSHLLHQSLQHPDQLIQLSSQEAYQQQQQKQHHQQLGPGGTATTARTGGSDAAARSASGLRGDSTAVVGSTASKGAVRTAAAKRKPPSPPRRAPPAPSYAVLIDAGSSGTRVHVYRYTYNAPYDQLYGQHGGGGGGGVKQLPRQQQLQQQPSSYPDIVLPGRILRTTPGLSAFAPEGEGVEESLGPLIDFARDEVPPELHASTPIWLMATAGLRLLPDPEQRAVLAAARRVLAASGFVFRREWARIISGDEEGLFAWAGVNYAAGRLQALAEARAAQSGRRQPGSGQGAAAAAAPEVATLAVLELGGASMQLTLMPWEAVPAERRSRLVLPGVDRPLYTHSFLGFGLQVAWFREAMLVQQGGPNATDPCLHPGYSADDSGVTGSGSFADCAVLASRLIAEAAGPLPNPAAPTTTTTTTSSSSTATAAAAACGYERCSIGGEYLPRLREPGPPAADAAAGAGADVGGRGGSVGRSGTSSASSSSSSSGSQLKGGGRAGRHGGGGGGGGYVIMATEGFHYTMRRLGLPVNSSLEAIREAGTRFCAQSWEQVEEELIAEQGVSEEYALRVCFGAAYIHTLLSQGFRMGPEEAALLRFSNSVERPDGSQVEVNWVLGALLIELTLGQRRANAAAAAAAAAATSSASASSSTRSAAAASSAAGLPLRLPPPPLSTSSRRPAVGGQGDGGGRDGGRGSGHDIDTTKTGGASAVLKEPRRLTPSAAAKGSVSGGDQTAAMVVRRDQQAAVRLVAPPAPLPHSRSGGGSSGSGLAAAAATVTERSPGLRGAITAAASRVGHSAGAGLAQQVIEGVGGGGDRAAVTHGSAGAATESRR